jgi:hypothetical protein
MSQTINCQKNILKIKLLHLLLSDPPEINGIFFKSLVKMPQIKTLHPCFSSGTGSAFYGLKSIKSIVPVIGIKTGNGDFIFIKI